LFRPIAGGKEMNIRILIAIVCCLILAIPYGSGIASADRYVENNKDSKHTSNQTIINDDGSISIMSDGIQVGYLPPKTDLNIINNSDDNLWYSSIEELLSQNPSFINLYNILPSNFTNYQKFRFMEKYLDDLNRANSNKIEYYPTPDTIITGQPVNFTHSEKDVISEIPTKKIINSNSTQTITPPFTDKGLATGGTIGQFPGTFSGWEKELFTDDFQDNDDHDWQHYWSPTTFIGGSGTVGIVNDGGYKLQIYSPWNVASKAYTQTYNVPFDEDYDYKISFDFQLKTTDNHWIDVFNNNDIYLEINYVTNLEWFDGSASHFIMDIGTSQHHIDVFVDISAGTYRIFIDGTYITTANILSLSTDPLHYFRFGDSEMGTSNFGKAQWDNIKIIGQYDWNDYLTDYVPPPNPATEDNGVKFFDDFDSHLFYSWSTWGHNSDTLELDNGDLHINAQNVMYIQSRPIDYDTTNFDYWADFYFKIISTDTSGFFAFYNGEIILKVESGNVLKIGSSGGTWVTVYSSLSPLKWYHIRVWIDTVPGGVNKIGGVYINNMNLNVITPSIYNTYGTANKYFTMGDGDSSTSAKGNAEWKFASIEGTKIGGNAGDSDSDGLSNTFENGNNILLYGDDAEDPWYAGGYINPGPYFDNVWERGNPTSSGSDPTRGNGASVSVYGTKIDALYPNSVAAEKLKTPYIDFFYVQSGTSPTLVFNHWYHTEERDPSQHTGWDGGNVGIARGSNNPTLLGSYPNQYNCDGIYALSDADGFCAASNLGWSSNWIRSSFTIPSSWVGYPDDRIIFSFGSDGSGQDWGWYIDDIKIFASSNPNSANTDNDQMPDGIEFYHMGSSPFVIDTDYDGLSDKMEYPYDGRSDSSIVNTYAEINDPFYWGNILTWARVSPTKKDIFIQVDYEHNAQIPSVQIDSVATKFLNHGIIIHYRYINELTARDTTTWNDLVNDYNAHSIFVGEYRYFVLGVHEIPDEFPNLIVGKAAWPGDMGMVDTPDAQTCTHNMKGVIMHELGHMLYLHSSTQMHAAYSDESIMFSDCSGLGIPFDYSAYEWRIMDLDVGLPAVP
jgi:hypothetical protein